MRNQFFHAVRLLAVFFIVCFYPVGGFGDITLVQEFSETFTTGSIGWFGYSVSGAGDVNGDGHDDVIVGAWGCNFMGGRAYLFFGGPGRDGTPDVIMKGRSIYDNYGSNLGHTVCGPGDVNGDGYDDVIVGAMGFSLTYVYYGGPFMDGTEDLTLAGATDWYHLGYSISGTGDVNGDGWDDFIAGEPDYWATNSDQTACTGRAYVYFGGPSVDNVADVTMTGEEAYSLFGTSVSAAGDIDKDGYADVMIGAPGDPYRSVIGRVYVFRGGPAMDGNADLILPGVPGFGKSVSGMCDLNKDGNLDFVVGAPETNLNTGFVSTYYGTGGLSFSPGIQWVGEAADNYFGCSVSCPGDINGDGYSDVVAGAYGYYAYTGRAYVYFGGNSMKPEPDVIMTGDSTNGTKGHFGFSVSGAGDFNDDGCDDVVVGANRSNLYLGQSMVYYGGPSMNGEADMVLSGEPTNNFFGYSVSGAGDVNGDGYKDIMVGEHTFVNSFGLGHVYIYFGGSSLDNTADVILTAPAVSDWFGRSISGAGDVNQDGYDDVIVGAQLSNSNSGRVYLYYGGSGMDNTVDVTLTGNADNGGFGSSVSGAGDVNNDGFDDVIVQSNNQTTLFLGSINMGGEPNWVLQGGKVSRAGDVNGDGFDDVIAGSVVYFGGPYGINWENCRSYGVSNPSSVSGAGDVNGDGFDDIVAGTWMANQYAGRAFVSFGSPLLDGTVVVDLTGDPTMEQFGWFTHGERFGISVSGAGDVNNDGYADVVVGADWHGIAAGRVYVYYGGPDMDGTADMILEGEEVSDNFGFSVSGAGDVNGDGVDEFIAGAIGHDSHNGKVYVYNCVSTFMLSMTANPEDGGTTIPADGDHTYTSGQSVGISASPADGYEFLNWTGDVADPNNPNTTVLMDANKSLTANFLLMTVESLIEKVEALNLENGLENSLVQKLDNANKFLGEPGDFRMFSQTAQALGVSKINAAVNKLNAFINEVEAQSGKKITESDAGQLIAYAEFLINAIQGGLAKRLDPDMEFGPVPTDFCLYQNHPNPFNPETRIAYALPEACEVRLAVYSLGGKKVAELEEGRREAGDYTAVWNAAGFPSGVYLIRFQAGSFVQMRKCLLMK